MDPPSVFDHPEPPTSTSIQSPNHPISLETQNSLNPSTTDPQSPGTQSNRLQSSTHTTQDVSSQPITLDQEILDLKKALGGVGASLGGWWGKVQKQSAEVLAASKITAQINDARKDLASLNIIEKAKKEVERLGDHAKEGYSAIASEIEKGPNPNSIEDRIVNVDGIEITPSSHAIPSSSIATALTATENETAIGSKGKERAPDEPPTSPTNPSSVFDSSRLSSFFSKITKDSESLTASLHSKIPQLPSSGSFDLTEIQKRAEGYLAKGEVYLQDVGKELKEFVQDAVKVIPPSEDEAIHDPDQTGKRNSLSDSGLNEKRRLLDLRRESLISQLRRDKSKTLVDPRNEDVHVQNAFDEFILSLQQAGGLEGEAWKKRIDAELELEEPDRSALKDLLENLVPSSMTFETFWTRYFFRIYQIDQEEAARRLVLKAAQEDVEGEFSWDIEDESEPSSPAVLVKSREISDEVESAGKEDQAETPKPSNLSNSMIGSDLTHSGNRAPTEDQSPEEDEWGNSPVENTFSPVGTKAATTKESSATNHQVGGSQVSRRNSSSEPDTSDGFDVVSAQQSSDENQNKYNKNQASKENCTADDDSDWE